MLVYGFKSKKKVTFQINFMILYSEPLCVPSSIVTSICSLILGCFILLLFFLMPFEGIKMP